MGEQVQLNGAYYGPPVPPRAKTYSSVGRHRSCCGPCCLLTTLLKLIISLVFLIGLVLLIIWLIFRPNKIQVYVESATLTQFTLNDTNNTTLNYDLDLNVSIRNPNKRVGFYYDYIEARGIYDGSRFGFQELPTFYQGHKNTTMLHPSFQGSQVALGSVESTYNREKGEGDFYIQVKFYPSVRLKVKFVRVGHFHPKFDCVVKLPVPPSTNSKTAAAVSFERTKCDVHIF